MSEPVVAAIDIGTTSIRVWLFAGDGTVRAKVGAPLESHFPGPGRVEHDANGIVHDCVRLIHDACHQASVEVHDIDSIGIACQRGTFVGWHVESGQPVEPAIGWQDSRTREQVNELRAAGIPLNTMASCTKIGWMLNESSAAQAALAQGALRVGTLDTWLTWKLTGGRAFITDPSNASATGLYDPSQGSWNPGALEFFGIEPSIMAEIVATADRPQSQRHRWVDADAMLAARIGDQQAACFAHGLREGDAKLTLGTSAMLDVGIGSAPVSGPPGAHSLPLWRFEGPDPSSPPVEPYCLEANIATAGGLIEWLVRIGHLGSVGDLDAVAAAGRPGPIVVPALAGLGAPHDDSSVRAVFGAIGLETTAADLVLAAVDGIALRAAELCDALEVGHTLLVDGGLTRSSVMLRRLADLTGRTVVPSAEPEMTLRGTFLLANTGRRDEHRPPAHYAKVIAPSISEDERGEQRRRFEAAIHAAASLA